MDTYAIERFCERWIVKADAYRSNNLEDLFDRFFTLFVAYNRFYSAAAELHRATIDPRQAQLLQGDRREATSVMARLIRQSRFADAMNGNSSIAVACQDISTMLQERRFFLHSVRGTKEPDRARDAKLADGLRKHSLLSVLECLYQIRCNIFHGEKEFAPQQAELLAPAIILLAAIVSLSRGALYDAAC
ncbi:hypothetical protein ACO0LM_27735 [Undibacterium sp. Di26W]|uniref:hypothetical protein n=1 Tax=Undibacterium sp. Di26W TaxID=3413035 RepID=UPI003BF14A93